ncbi:LOW QUALITY PROTEIN: Proton-dependent oligopeptide transporter family [Dillenia turbinata]|uniref:Proton-dependent oligopeptide transporter family n=1 Tax=Dillenia turbinata TaxID=194707 RepID=A0AAN8WBM2_9MAGN
MGRYWTIARNDSSNNVSFSLADSRPSCDQDNCRATASQTAVCYIALYFTAVGTGGIKPCVSSFGADQFDDNDDKESEKKSSFFNWFYLSINVGNSITSGVYLDTNECWLGLGFGIPAVAMANCNCVLFSVSCTGFRNSKESPDKNTPGCGGIKLRKHNVRVPDDRSLLYETADAGKATLLLLICKKIGSRAHQSMETMHSNPSRGTQGHYLRLLPVWASGIVFAAVYSQMSTLFGCKETQWTDMWDLALKFHLLAFPSSTQLVLSSGHRFMTNHRVPYARKFTGHERWLTQLQRMGVGLVISVFSMITAGVLEVILLGIGRRNNYYDLEYIPMTIFWQVPQYFLIGCAYVFTFVGQLEFFMTKHPDSEENGGKICRIPDSNLNRGHLDYFYWLLAILSVINSLVYIWGLPRVQVQESHPSRLLKQ